MVEKERYIDRSSLVIASGMLLIIVYASLYRFRTRIHPDPIGPFRFLLSTWNTLSKPSDVLANVLFYVPFGFFFARSFTRTRQAITIALVTISGLLLSFGMESLQFYIVRRYAAMSDVYADTLGALLGAVAAFSARRVTGPFSFGPPSNRFVVLLLASWLGGQLFPYIPVINAHKYWDALKPLIFSPVLPPFDVYNLAVAWLAIALLLEALFGVARSRSALAFFFSAVVFARVLIARIVLSPAEVVGGIAAILAWTFLSRFRTRAIIVTALFVTGVVLQGLEPFQFTSTARSFGWIPFRSFLTGSLDGAVISFFEKVFSYGCLIWLLMRSGRSWLSSTVWGATLVMVLRLIQIYLPGRSAEITDAVMVLIIAGIMRLISDASFEERPEPRTASSMMPS
jgi:VanZ family protein